MQEMFDYLFNICMHFWELNFHDFCVVSSNLGNCFKQFKFKIIEGIFGRNEIIKNVILQRNRNPMR